ncbi:hypothetical protein PIB30_085202 [Stylosanthes scabra]|uniref:Uncharacterized protein n=1 Tax=Stylosanthes scabra TaxID=79078 RepID=A0ABU6ZS17_9FABA|nr:hypothetical protein [Stylosanthes scabra]
MGTQIREIAENMNQDQVIAAVTIEDHTLSGKKKEGSVDQGLNLNTVECLRGRLLAERHASRVAKEQAESMDKKLVELERMIKEEIKLRERAQSKLRFLKKKFETLNISSISMKSHHHSDYYSCENSSGSSSSSSVTSISKHSSEAVEKKDSHHHEKNEDLPENNKVVYANNNNNVTEEASAIIFQTQICSSTTKDSDSEISFCYSNSSSEDLKNDDSRVSSLSSKSSVTEKDDDEKGNFIDNSMALVPVNVAAATLHAKTRLKPLNQSVLEALEALEQAKERIRSSMETRQIIHVGPNL